MSSESNEPKPESRSDRLPFEPTQNRKKPAQTDDTAAAKTAKKSAKKPSGENRQSAAKQKRSADSVAKTPKADKPKASQGRRSSPDQTAIPKVVSDRMARRMAIFCGIPTVLGISTFIVSYFLVTKGWFKLPNVAVVLVSMGFLGLGVIGLTYGILSASWDEERVGSWFGYEEFSVNFGRMRGAWKEAKAKKTIGD
jgi:Photosynthesis affected mutant 68